MEFPAACVTCPEFFSMPSAVAFCDSFPASSPPFLAASVTSFWPDSIPLFAFSVCSLPLFSPTSPAFWAISCPAFSQFADIADSSSVDASTASPLVAEKLRAYSSNCGFVISVHALTRFALCGPNSNKWSYNSLVIPSPARPARVFIF